MNRGTWKEIERQWAERLGGTRVPVTGRARSAGVPDVEHPRFAVEIKAGQVLSARLLEALEQAEAAAKATGRLPLVCVSHSYGRGRPNRHAVVLPLATWRALTATPEEETP